MLHRSFCQCSLTNLARFCKLEVSRRRNAMFHAFLRCHYANSVEATSRFTFPMWIPMAKDSCEASTVTFARSPQFAHKHAALVLQGAQAGAILI